MHCINKNLHKCIYKYLKCVLNALTRKRVKRDGACMRVHEKRGVCWSKTRNRVLFQNFKEKMRKTCIFLLLKILAPNFKDKIEKKIEQRVAKMRENSSLVKWYPEHSWKRFFFSIKVIHLGPRVKRVSFHDENFSGVFFFVTCVHALVIPVYIYIYIPSIRNFIAYRWYMTYYLYVHLSKHGNISTGPNDKHFDRLW